MKVEVTLTAADFLRFTAWCYYRSALVMKLLAIGAALNGAVALVGVFVFPSDILAQPINAVFVFILPLTWFVLLPVSAVIGFRKSVKSNPGVFCCSYEFRPDGVSIQSQRFTGNEEWGLYRRVVETSTDFYLYITSLNARVIPKRCMTEDQLKEFRELLSASGKMRAGASGG